MVSSILRAWITVIDILNFNSMIWYCIRKTIPRGDSLLAYFTMHLFFSDIATKVVIYFKISRYNGRLIKFILKTLKIF